MQSVFVIAEAGVNHNGSLKLAKELVDAAHHAGADAIKFQTFKAENIVTKSSPKANYQKETTQSSETQFEMIKRLELSFNAHKELLEYSKELGIQFLSTPFDLESLDFLSNSLQLSLLKIPSGEITNSLLLLNVARTMKPVIMSTGMSTLGEIEDALGVLAFGYLQENLTPSIGSFKKAYFSEAGQNCLKEKVTLLHCTTEYPAPFSDVNLRVIKNLQSAFGLPVGFSDHTSGVSVSIAAVALGAVIIEKHFTLDRNLPGPDHKASLTPEQLKEMIAGIRQVEMALGNSTKIPTPSEISNRQIARRSLVAKKKIVAGERFTEENISVKRPGGGISPMTYWTWLGKTASIDYEIDDMIK